jgi:hypothetical protein
MRRPPTKDMLRDWRRMYPPTKSLQVCRHACIPLWRIMLLGRVLLTQPPPVLATLR